MMHYVCTTSLKNRFKIPKIYIDFDLIYFNAQDGSVISKSEKVYDFMMILNNKNVKSCRFVQYIKDSNKGNKSIKVSEKTKDEIMAELFLFKNFDIFIYFKNGEFVYEISKNIMEETIRKYIVKFMDPEAGYPKLDNILILDKDTGKVYKYI